MAYKRSRSEPEAPMLPRAQCAHDGCLDGAILRRQTPTGWANFCAFHAERHWMAICRDTTAALGLRTKDQMRAWCTDHASAIGRQRPGREWAHRVLADPAAHPSARRLAEAAAQREFRSRTPGEDDDLEAESERIAEPA